MQNIPEKIWKVVLGLCGILIIFFIIISIKEIKMIGYVGANQNMTNTIAVDGVGESVAVPDIATVDFTISEKAKTVAEAQKAATSKMNSVFESIKGSGVAEKDISTTAYNINPEYEYQNRANACPLGTSYCPAGRSVIVGYNVSQSIQIKIRDLSKAGSLLTLIGQAGVSNVGGLNFQVDNPDAVKATARAEAIAKAEAKAKQIAKDLNVRLVRVVSFYESDGNPIIYGMGMKEMSVANTASVPAPVVPVGEQKVTSRVTISYEIK